MTRRRLFTASLVGLLPVASACAWVAGLEPVPYGSVDGGGAGVDGTVGGEAGSAEAASDASDGADGDRDSAPDPCDFDRDGVRATACGGADCDDHDPRVRPDAAFTTDLLPDGGADWNCDGVETPEYGHHFGCGGDAAACVSRSGYTSTPPACGGTDIFTTCDVDDSGTGCRVVSLSKPHQQACR